MLRRLALISLALLLLAPVACDDEDAPPAGPPRERFGTEAVEGVLAVELIRSRLVPVTDLVALGRHEDAARHLEAARERWRRLSGEIRDRDPVLAREVSVAFERVRRALQRRGTFDAVRDVASPLGAQLLGGVREDLVEKEARLDSGVNAAVLARLLDRFDERYAAGDRLAVQHAFGIVDRSQSVAREIAGDLGDRRDAVIEGLKDLREAAFPDGIALPQDPAPPGDVSQLSADVRQALQERFEL